jgi:hypothetical protein
MDNSDVEKMLQEIIAELPSDSNRTEAETFTLAFGRLLTRGPGWPTNNPELESMMAMAPRIAAFEIGEVAKRYGPFRLHAVALVMKDGRREEQPYYQIIIGEHETPIRLTMDTVGADKEGQRHLIGLTAPGQIRQDTSTLRDVVKHLKRQLLTWQAGTDYFREWQRAHPDRAAMRDSSIRNNEEDYRRTAAALRVLDDSFRDEIAAQDVEMSPEEVEQEIRNLRLRLQWMDSLMGLNRVPLPTAPEPAPDGERDRDTQ